jgi:ketosteroid isomerase-like protein
LIWEPRFGDIAASGELGYLTGPASRIVHTDPQQPVTELAYFSIWKRQPDGTFKVFIDQGITTPQAVTFPDGFTRADASNRYTGNGADGNFTLSKADSTKPPPMVGDAHVYRDGQMPFIGKAAAQRIYVDERDRRTESLYAEAAKSADLGITYGRYTLKDESGHYVRVWTRSRTGRWQLAFEVTAPQR